MQKMKNRCLWASLALRLAGLEMLEGADLLVTPTAGWHFNTMAAYWLRFSAPHEISGFLWKKNTVALSKYYGGCEMWWSRIGYLWQKHAFPHLPFCSHKLGLGELGTKNQVMSAPENIPVRVRCSSDPLFESHESSGWTCEGNTCYTLTNTEFTKLVFYFNWEQRLWNCFLLQDLGL